MMEMDIIGHVINGFQLKIREALITRKITTVEKMIEHANLTRQKDINNQEDMFIKENILYKGDINRKTRYRANKEAQIKKINQATQNKIESTPIEKWKLKSTNRDCKIE